MLGIWHTYKQLNLLIWHRFLRFFLAGAMHALNPNTKVFVKPKLIYLVSVFTSLRNVWPHIKTAWSAAYANIPSSHPVQRQQLLSLKDLFTFWIPLVSLHYQHITSRHDHVL